MGTHIKQSSLLVATLLTLLFPLFAFSPALLAAPPEQSSALVIETRVAALQQSIPAWQDDFETPAADGLWSEETTESSGRYFDNGAYTIWTVANDAVTWSLAGDLAYQDLILQVDTQAVAGGADNEFGLIFRYVDETDFYGFSITSEGNYALYRQSDGEWIYLVEWSAAEAINTSDGAWNRLTVLAEGSELSVLANGTLLASVEDEPSSMGQIGLLAGAYSTDGAEIAFDNFAVWDLQNLTVPEAEMTATPTPNTPARPATSTTATERVDAIRSQPPTLHDDFRYHTGDWSVEPDTMATRALHRGSYILHVQEAERIVWGGLAEPLDLSDFLAEIEVSHSAGPLENEMGLVFRFVDEQNFYYFRISSDGFFAFDRMFNGEWESLLAWEASPLIETGERSSNLIAVLAEGTTFTFLINDELVATVEEPVEGDALTRGDLKPAAGAFAEAGVEVAFDDLYLWNLAEAVVAAATPTTASTVAPTVAPTAASTPTPASTAAPTVDVALLLAEMRSRDPLFSDDFRSADSGWPTIEESDYSIAYADRALLFTNNKTNWTSWSFNEQLAQLAPASFLLEVDAEHLAGPINVGYGIIFGYQDNEHYYRFLVAQDGNVTLQQIGGTPPLPWTISPALRTEPGSINRLGVLVDGDTITLLINDEVVGQVTVAEPPTGSIALMAGTADVPGLVVAFDNFDLWLP